MAAAEKITRVSETGLTLIKEFEGLARVGNDGRIHAYRCPAGHWTIGYGHTEGVGPNSVITREEAEQLLLEDVAKFSAQVAAKISVPYTQTQFDALVSLAFNIGIGAFAGSSALREMNAGRISNVPAKMQLWNKITVNGKKVVSNGLVRRRTAEAALFAMDIAPLGNSEPTSVPQEVTVGADKPLSQSREMRGSLFAGLALFLSETLSQVASALEPAGALHVYIRYGFLACTVAGILFAAYARWDANRKDAR